MPDALYNEAAKLEVFWMQKQQQKLIPRNLEWGRADLKGGHCHTTTVWQYHHSFLPTGINEAKRGGIMERGKAKTIATTATTKKHRMPA